MTIHIGNGAVGGARLQDHGGDDGRTVRLGDPARDGTDILGESGKGHAQRNQGCENFSHCFGFWVNT